MFLPLVDGVDVTFDITGITSAIKTVLQPFLTNLTPANIATILAIIIGACLILYVFYWGVRKAIRMLEGAFTKGKLRM